MPDLATTKRYVRRPFSAPLDESLSPDRNPGFLTAQNIVYRRFGAVGKRTGSVSDTNFGALPVISGTRFYRGVPSILRQMIVQANDQLWLRNDATGVYTSIGTLAPGSTPAFYCQAYDPAASSDILIIAYGSGPPMKWDGATLSALNASITNSFAGCTFWHEHVWFWGDAANPDTVYATDLGAPESYAFSTNFGGYQVGRGSGDSIVQCCVPFGATLAVVKARSVYLISGFDFAQGEYQFQDQPWITDNGTTAPHSVAVLRGTLIFWNGQAFYRAYPGSQESVNIGVPVIRTSGLAAPGIQSLMCAVAGDFNVMAIDGASSYTGVYMCALDIGKSVADTIVVYDDDASQFFGKPAWSVWNGFTVGCFIPWSGAGDQRLLFAGDGVTSNVRQIGGSSTADDATPYVVTLQTGRDNAGADETLKHISHLYLDTEANQVTFGINIASDLGTNQAQSQAVAPESSAVASPIGSFIIGTSAIGTSIFTAYQPVDTYVDPSLDGHNFTFTLTESSTLSAYELIALAYLIEEEVLAR